MKYVVIAMGMFTVAVIGHFWGENMAIAVVGGWVLAVDARIL